MWVCAGGWWRQRFWYFSSGSSASPGCCSWPWSTTPALLSLTHSQHCQLGLKHPPPSPALPPQELSTLDLVIAGTSEAVLMIEGFCDFLTEEQMLEVRQTCMGVGRSVAILQYEVSLLEFDTGRLAMPGVAVT